MRLFFALTLIRNGDVFLFRRSPSLFGRLIRLWTQSPFSHVGIALWVQVDGTRRLCILEALEGVGVRLHPMDRYLEECQRQGCLIDWYQVTDPAINRDRIAGYALDQWGARYAHPLQFVWSWGRLSTRLRRWLGLTADTDPERWFCSELVAAALKHAGYVPDSDLDLDPAETEPGMVALFPCLQRRGAIEP